MGRDAQMFVRIVATVRSGPTRAQSIAALLGAVHRLNVSYLRANKNTPRLYESGVIYSREPVERREEFATIPAVIAQGWGDCDDLAPWLSAELAVREGIDARPVVYSPRAGLYHCVVRLPSGQILDPSKRLGM